MTAHQVPLREGGGFVSPEELAALRAWLDEFAASVSVTEPIAQVTDTRLDLGDRVVPLRRYVPDGADDAVLVWFHGGGFISGTLDAIDPVCRSLARRARVTVVSVGYRLAPEHPFPAAYDDCAAALAEVARVTDRVAVGGDSAGGGLAAAVARSSSYDLAALVLLCPFLDLTLSCPSVRTAADDLTEESLRGFVSMYGGDPADPRVSPLLTPDLSRMPPAVVVTAEHDPLRDEGEAFAARLVDAGGRADVRRWDGMVHGFPGMTAQLPEADEALQWAAERLRALLDARA